MSKTHGHSITSGLKLEKDNLDTILNQINNLIKTNETLAGSAKLQEEIRGLEKETRSHNPLSRIKNKTQDILSMIKGLIIKDDTSHSADMRKSHRELYTKIYNSFTDISKELARSKQKEDQKLQKDLTKIRKKSLLPEQETVINNLWERLHDLNAPNANLRTVMQTVYDKNEEEELRNQKAKLLGIRNDIRALIEENRQITELRKIREELDALKLELPKTFLDELKQLMTMVKELFVKNADQILAEQLEKNNKTFARIDKGLEGTETQVNVSLSKRQNKLQEQLEKINKRPLTEEKQAEIRKLEEGFTAIFMQKMGGGQNVIISQVGKDSINKSVAQEVITATEAQLSNTVQSDKPAVAPVTPAPTAAQLNKRPSELPPPPPKRNTVSQTPNATDTQKNSDIGNSGQKDAVDGTTKTHTSKPVIQPTTAASTTPPPPPLPPAPQEVQRSTTTSADDDITKPDVTNLLEAIRAGKQLKKVPKKLEEDQKKNRGAPGRNGKPGTNADVADVLINGIPAASKEDIANNTAFINSLKNSEIGDDEWDDKQKQDLQSTIKDAILARRAMIEGHDDTNDNGPAGHDAQKIEHPTKTPTKALPKKPELSI